MKSNDIDQMLSGLLGPQDPKKKAPPEPKEEPRQSAASEASRRRVEAMLRDVEEENSRRKAYKPAASVQTPPVHEPVVQPDPISHFAEEPSQYPAVRMHDRLDEISLPMLDADRKPNQIIPPRPKEEPVKKKKRRPAAPANATPKKKAFRVEIPDELPPDIPRDTSIADALRRQRENGQAEIAQDAIYAAALERAGAERRAKDERIAEEKRRAEEARIAEERRRAEEARIAEERRRAEEARIAEENRRAAAARKAEEIRRAREAAAETENVDDPQQPVQEDDSRDMLERASQLREEIRQIREDVASIPEENFAEEVQKAPKLRHLEEMDTEKTESRGLFGLFSRKKKNLTEEPDIPEEDSSDDDDAPGMVTFTEEISEPAEPDPIPEDVPLEEDIPLEEEIPAEREPAEGIQEEPEAAETPEETSIHVALPNEKQRKHRFSKALHEALDESAQELAEIKAEPIPEQSEIDVAVGKSRFWSKHSYFIVGILCSLLAMVGAYTCVRLGVERIQAFTSGSSLREELEDFLYPATAVDLPAFETADELSDDSRMAVAMLDLLMYGDLSGYTRNFDIISIPAQDVADRAAQLFDGEPVAEFTSIQAAAESFYYDAASRCYNVPASPSVFTYSPSIQTIERYGDSGYIVTVDYITDRPMWQKHSDNFEDDPVKTMEYTLEKTGSGYRIIRIVNMSDQAM